MPQPVTVRAQALDGQWETIGVDRSAGIWVETPTFESGWWGPSKASFTLKRDGRRAFPDLSTYTPIDALVGEKPVWAGRTSETPISGGQSISVQCDGAQYHLDDHVYEKFYAHSRLGDWKDTRSLPGARLDVALSRYTVNAGAGGIQIGAAKGTEWVGSTGVGVTLDLGPANNPRALMMAFNSTPESRANTYLYVRLSVTPDPYTAPVYDVFPGSPLSAFPNAAYGTAPAGYRYAHVFLFRASGGTFTTADDAMLYLTGIGTFADPAYMAGPGSSNLLASDVINDAITLGAPLLSADRSLIATTVTTLNDFYVDGPRSPREYITNANAYHNYKVGVDARRRGVFQPRPSSPIYEIGEWSGATVDDLSANAGEAIYDGVIVRSTSPNGQPVRVTRTAPFAVATTRRGFHRTKVLDVGFALPSDGVLAAALGDAWLGQNYLTPMKGTIKAKAGDIRAVATGQSVSLEDLLGASHEMIRLMDRPDPDTGGWGRDARIAGAKWNPVTDEIEITLDNTRANFEALLARLAVVSGG